MDVIIFLLSFAVILAGCEFFTNGVEWAGKRFNLSEGAVGSVLAAVGTAMPETLVPLIAILMLGGEAGREIGVGAILGAPFMLATMALFYLRPVGPHVREAPQYQDPPHQRPSHQA